MLMLVLVVAFGVSAQDDVVTLRSSAPVPSQYALQEIADGFQRPVYLTDPNDGTGRLFIVEQYTGEIWILQDGERLDTPFLDVGGLLSTRGNEEGLLGLAFHPEYADNGTFFIYYNDIASGVSIARYQVSADDPNLADFESAEVILSFEHPYSNHNGGQLAFGPDGYLYAGVGDGGSANDPHGNGQNTFVLLGKILRLDVDTGSSYAIPPDNPFADGSAGAPEVWAFGLRNPWRFSFDRATGDLYIGDVGQNRWEEIDFEPADSPGGVNYGWNAYEGNHAFSGAAAPADMVLPVAEYGHDQGISVTGGYVYRGEALPDLQGVYIYSDYAFGTFWALYRDESGNWQNMVFMDTSVTPSSFGEDAQGELYVVNHGGSILKLVAAE
jgi:glucose/arabinose dehydrogenase